MGGSQSVEVPGGGSEGYHVLKVSGRGELRIFLRTEAWVSKLFLH